MLTDALRIGHSIGKLSLWGALLYGTIIPAYRFADSLDQLNQLAYSIREHMEARTDEYRTEQFKGIFRYAERKEQEGEQGAIRRFRRNIEDVLGENCHTTDSSTYELPRLEPVGNGKYELRMECDGRMMAVPLGKVELR